MSDVNVSQNNWVGGELSPKMRGRYNLPVYVTGAERFVNFVPEMQGPATFRNGSQFVVPTRRNQIAWYIPFQFNDSQSYLLEFTHKYFRILRDNGILVEEDKTITGISAGTITIDSHGYEDGDEIFIFDVGGVEGLNGKNFLVDNATTDTFTLTDTDGNVVTGSGSYVSGGVAEKIVEVKTPYWEEDLPNIKTTQNADTMYLDMHFYEPRKLIRSSASTWTLQTYERTADPFTDKKTITGITAASQAVVTATSHGYTEGDTIIIENITGMTELNGEYCIVSGVSGDSFKIKDRNGDYINSTAFTAWSAGGYCSDQKLLPATNWFYESRLLHGCSDYELETFWGSRTPTTDGTLRYDDYTLTDSGEANTDNAFKFTIAPTSGKVEKIQWFAGTTRYFAIGTFGGVLKVNGGNDDTALSPSTINVRPAVINGGGASSVAPVPLGNALLYIQRTGKILFNLEYDFLTDSFVADDKNLVSDHITGPGIKQMFYQNSRPESVWLVREDGVLLQVVYKSKEKINGWARVVMGGTDAKVLTAGPMPRTNKFDQIWVCVERTINGKTRRYNEFLSDAVAFPELIDEYGDETTEAEDKSAWQDGVYEAQKQSIHLDSSLILNTEIDITNIELV